jgi:hypothetical protein
MVLDQDYAIEVGLDSMMKVATGYRNGMKGAEVYACSKP